MDPHAPPRSPPSDPARAQPRPGDAYCANCGYILTGLTEASRCPECGKPLVEVLTRVPYKRFGRSIRYRSAAMLFGVPVIDVAFGPMLEQGQSRGVAKGIIALGDVAIGGIAVGNMSFGIVTVGGLSAGVSAIGGGAVGVLNALGGLAMGGFAVGGMAIGAVATGGGAVGIVAQGGGATGVYVRGGGVAGVYRETARASDPEAVRMFNDLSPLIGRSSAPGLFSPARAALTDVVMTGLVALSVALVAIGRLRSQRSGREGMGT